MRLLSRAWRAVRTVLPGLLDLHLYGGGLALSWGAWSVYEPAGWMAGGAILMSIAVWRIRRMPGGSA